jgi:hypothetical protein
MAIDTCTPLSGIGCRLGLGLGTLLLLTEAPALAQEYCVSCSEPAGLYRCVIENAQPRGGQSLQMLCVTTMAREGGHATCSVKRGTIFDCDAPVKRIPWAALDQSPPADAAQPPAPAVRPQVQPATAPQPAPVSDAPPQTVVDLAKQANEKTAEQVKKAGESVKQAGESVKQATKKTWDCVFSFFTRCGE